MAAGSLYLLLFGGCFVFLLVTAATAWVLYVVGRRREAMQAAARAARQAATLQNRDAAPVLSEALAPDSPDRGGPP